MSSFSCWYSSDTYSWLSSAYCPSSGTALLCHVLALLRFVPALLGPLRPLRLPPCDRRPPAAARFLRNPATQPSGSAALTSPPLEAFSHVGKPDGPRCLLLARWYPKPWMSRLTNLQGCRSKRPVTDLGGRSQMPDSMNSSQAAQTRVRTLGWQYNTPYPHPRLATPYHRIRMMLQPSPSLMACPQAIPSTCRQG